MNRQPRSPHRAPFNQSPRSRERQYSAHQGTSTSLTERRSTSPPGNGRYQIRLGHRLRPNTIRQSFTRPDRSSAVPVLPPIRPSQVPRPARDLRHRHPTSSAVPVLPLIPASQLPRPARDLRHRHPNSPSAVPMLSLIRPLQVPWSARDLRHRHPNSPPVRASQIPRPESQRPPKVPFHILPPIPGSQIPRPAMASRPPIFAADAPALPLICPFKFDFIDFCDPFREDYCLEKLPHYPTPPPLTHHPEYIIPEIPTYPRLCNCQECFESRLEKPQN